VGEFVAEVRDDPKGWSLTGAGYDGGHLQGP
jgi:hypothetical protein